MKNKAFEQLTAFQKKKKLSAVLRKRTGGLLRDEETAAIIRHIPMHAQYSILIYRDRTVMLTRLMESPSSRARILIGGEHVSAQHLDDRFAAGGGEDTMIAVITRCVNSARRILFIYIPPCRKRIEHYGEKRESKKTRV